MDAWYAGQSKPYDLDDTDGESGSFGTSCSEILLLPVLFILGVVCAYVFVFCFVLAVAAYCFYQNIKATLYTLKTGKLEHPFFAYYGGWLAIGVFFFYFSGLAETFQLPVYFLLVSIVLIIILTILPFIALLVRELAKIALKAIHG